ncbi:MAG: DinB family protein [Anaerolineales bacterium]|nr:DinB family protein [Anaerolineales bacterium]
MEIQRKTWNERQQSLRRVLSRPEDHALATEGFLCQQAMHHASEMARAGLYSFEDAVWDGLGDADARCIPPKFEHSIIWCIWHLTRIEDVTMNLLLAGTPQLFLQDGWVDCLGVPNRDTGNGMEAADITHLSTGVDISTLRAYRQAVGRRTRQIVQGLPANEMKLRIDPDWLLQGIDQGAVHEKGRYVFACWGGRTKAELLRMPPTRHTMVHLNEALRIRQMVYRQRQA